MSVQEITDKGQKVVERIAKFGIEAQAYKRGPDGSGVFSVSINRDKTLMLWPGNSTIEIKGSTAKKQVVLNVVEPARKITQTLTGVSLYGGLAEPDMDSVKARLRSSFRVNIPDGAKVRWTYKNIKKTSASDGRYYYDGEVTVSIGETSQCFLVGYDESNLFVSMLPEKATSVANAHEILRPKGVDNRAVRQGEWFFQPVTEKVGEALDARVAARPQIIDYVEELVDENDNVTTHSCVQVLMNGKNYAIGWVTDRGRVGDWRTPVRRPHHSPLWLSEWHEIIRNREVVTEQANSRRWD